MKTRFCPSPTGMMHLGNCRTALFSALLAKALGGDFLLRIEDTDEARSDESFTQQLMVDLRFMHCDWQEGPEQDKGNGPYYQSARKGIYEDYYQQLLKAGKAYWCFCSEAELTVTRKAQLAAGHAPRYPGTCRHLTEKQQEEKKAKGIQPALRFFMPDDQTVSFTDLIQGPKNFSCNDMGDFIIKKADGSASFMFCNAVDDALMGVTHVLRGEDHLTNTPRQLVILETLGLDCPQYGHMPLIVGFDGKPLSKRNGSQSVAALREQGYLPLALSNYLARLGHHFPEDKLLSFSELGAQFNMEHIGRSPARFDIDQLNHWQKEVVLSLDHTNFKAWLRDYLSEAQNAQLSDELVKLIKENVVLPHEAQKWLAHLTAKTMPLTEEAEDLLKQVDGQFYTAFIEAVEAHGADYQAVQTTLGNATGLKGKNKFMPMRAVLTGRHDGPQLVDIFSFLGKETILARIVQQKEKRDPA